MQQSRQKHTDLKQLLSYVVRSVEKNTFPSHLSHLEEGLKTLYGNQEILHSTHADAVFVEELRSNAGDLAAGAALNFIHHKYTTNIDPDIIGGIISAALYKEGIKGVSKSERGAVNHLKRKFEVDMASYREEFQDVHAAVKAQESNLLHTLNKFRERARRRTAAYRKVVKKHYDEAVANYQSLEDTYNKHLALKTSVSYWTKQIDYHERKSSELGQLTFAIALITSLIVAVMFFLMLEPVGTARDALSASEKLSTPTFLRLFWENVHFGALGAFIVVTTIGSWMLRILVLRYLSHVHLRADADERVTMITTYLALLREEAVTKEDDRQMILQTLFRPAATGIVKDNAAPILMHEWMTKLSKSQGG